jgi:hypothetical protein
MPSENMLIPVMMFRWQIGGFNRINEEQRHFLEYWYWSSVFSNRYSSASNEVIIADSTALIQVARGETIKERGYFARLRSRVTEAGDLYSYSKKASATYRGILNLLGYAAGGLPDWSSTQKIDISMRLEDHHIYPRAYIAGRPELDLEQEEAEQLVDCVVNRTLITKPLNVQIGKKPPQTYLTELRQRNPKLASCLPAHLVPADMITEPTYNNYFGLFLNDRAKQIMQLIRKYAIDPAAEMALRYGAQSDSTEGRVSESRLRLPDMLADGRVRVGDRVYVKKQPSRMATITDGENVEFEGKHMTINAWGEQATGWPSINIYVSVILERTGQPLGELRSVSVQAAAS